LVQLLRGNNCAMDDEILEIGPGGKLGITEAPGLIETDDASNAVGTSELGESYGTGNPGATTDVMPPPGDPGRLTDEDAGELEPGDDPLTARDPETISAESTAADIGTLP
jgi:hypothetical protein